MHIGNKIKQLRTLKGINQQELADKVFKTRALVSYIKIQEKLIIIPCNYLLKFSK